MNIWFYKEGPYLTIYGEEMPGCDMVVVDEETGKRWLAAQDAFDEMSVELIKKTGI